MTGSIGQRESRRIQLLMFAVVMTAGIGNSGFQSILPAIGRTLQVPDWMIALTFSFSALMWWFSASLWARQLQRRSARTLIVIGLTGFCASLAVAAAALAAGLAGLIGAYAAITGLILSRTLYGCLGPAAPAAAQTMVVECTDRSERTRALTLMASGFGLGTIVGPAIAPVFILGAVGLAGPPIAFAVLGLAVIAGMFVLLPDQPGRHDGTAGEAGTRPRDVMPVRLADERIRGWMIAGFVSSHVQVVISQTLGFLIIDRLRLEPELAPSRIGIVLALGAGAMLASQWGLQPLLRLSPKRMVVWGSLATAAGGIGLAFSQGLAAMTVSFILTSLGFGLIRPGYTAGASLAVDETEQAAVAGHVTASNGFSFFAAPVIGILLYQVQQGLPYLLCAAVSLGLVLYIQAHDPT